MTFNLHEMVFTCDYPGEKKCGQVKKWQVCVIFNLLMIASIRFAQHDTRAMCRYYKLDI